MTRLRNMLGRLLLLLLVAPIVWFLFGLYYSSTSPVHRYFQEGSRDREVEKIESAHQDCLMKASERPTREGVMVALGVCDEKKQTDQKRMK